MINATNLKIAIDQLVDSRYLDPGAFDVFADRLLALGIDRFSFDALTNETHFYTKREYVHSNKRRDLVESQASNQWTLGKVFDGVAVKTAIKKFDAGESDPIQFHRELFSAGVIFCSIFLKQQKILYLGIDGQMYWEAY